MDNVCQTLLKSDQHLLMVVKESLKICYKQKIEMCYYTSSMVP